MEGHEHDGQRLFRSGQVHSISCDNDLLLIRIPRILMDDYCDQVDDYMDQPHPPMSFASRFLNPLKKVVMISCPGNVSHLSRLIEELAKDNHFGVTTSLSEVDIASERVEVLGTSTEW